MDSHSLEFSEIRIILSEKEIEAALANLRFSEIKHVLAYTFAWMSDPLFCPSKPVELQDKGTAQVSADEIMATIRENLSELSDEIARRLAGELTAIHKPQ